VNLIRYDAACKALAEAKAVDEVKEIRDRAIAMKTYASQAKNLQLEIDAVQIRIRAERRLGEMIKAQKETVGLAKGQLRRGASVAPREDKPTLKAAGIDKHLAKRARKMAAAPEEVFKKTRHPGWQFLRDQGMP
jgi:hypothetical protein